MSPLFRLAALFALVAPLTLAGCGDTWKGLKKDTKENVEAVGEGLEKAGEKIRKSAD